MGTRRLVLLVGLVLIFASASSPIMAKEMVNMEFKQAPLVDVFQILGQLGGYNVLVDPTVQGEVTFTLKNLAVEEALDLVTRTTGYRYQLVGNTLVVGSEQRLKSEFGSQDFSFISIEHVDVKAAQGLVALVTPNVKSYVDSEQNLLILYGLTADLELATRVLKQYDQKTVTTPVPTLAEPAVEEDGFAWRTIPVFYAAGPEILEQVRQQWPLREFQWDDLTQNISGQITSEEWVEIKDFVQERDLPKFVLRGLLGTQEQMLALVEYRGVTTLLEQGDELNHWEATNIFEGGVEFSQGQRKFIIRMGR